MMPNISSRIRFSSVHKVQFKNIPPQRQLEALLALCQAEEFQKKTKTEPLWLYKPVTDYFDRVLTETGNLDRALEQTEQHFIESSSLGLSEVTAFIFQDDSEHPDASDLLRQNEQGKTSVLQFYSMAKEWAKPYYTLCLQEQSNCLQIHKIESTTD